MRRRCYSKTRKHHEFYFGKGIRVCTEWKDNFMTFYDWAINNGYNDNLTIDRININGNYEPSNCRWITIKEQQRNKSTNNKITYNNKTYCLAEWAEKLSITTQTLWNRIYRYNWSIECALITPKK